MDILVEYGVVPRIEMNLYWDHLLVVARVGRY